MHEATITASVPSADVDFREDGFTMRRIDDMASRALDVTIALTALLILGPLMLIIAAVIYILDPGPIIFAHQRIGRGGRAFPCLKFRSMVVDADARLRHLLETSAEAREEWERDHKLRDDPRVIGIGKFLRKTSLDELPQLINVVRGEMSLVGPRPIVVGEIARYGRYFEHYCAVRPGITGLWQVGGRNDVSYRRRVAYDVTYSRARSCAMNVKIMAYTVPSVLFQRGSY
ncbi:sugar transferase [Sphingomonas phyllosphaerae]|uniref:sugar transferase n=1 Tax=Sphingomonas phyllosphaerae TaxID=257003 RepID=UPI0024130EA4|nr:sugar transferase [Sphingomonas phyllosphaerae]